MTMLAFALAAYLFALWKRPLIYVGLVIQVAYIISRGADLGRLPLVGPHDTISFLAASMVAFAIPFAFALKKEHHSDFIGCISAIAAIFTVFALTAKQHNTPLPPILKTVWFECHVVLAFMSYALFGVAAVLGYFFLKDGTSVMDGLHYRAVLIGYCLFTLSMIFGGIWAYLAWGTYWVWTPKELWTSILWTYYSFYLHARLRQGWMGRPMAYLSVAGFAVVLFTYLGVSLLMKSSHSF